MVYQGHLAVVKVSSTGSSYQTVDGLNSAAISSTPDLEDVTIFGSGSGPAPHLKLPTLIDWTIDGSGFLLADANGQGLVRTSALTGALIYVQFLYNGTTGYSGSGYVKSFKEDASASSTAKFSFQIVGSSALSAVG